MDKINFTNRSKPPLYLDGYNYQTCVAMGNDLRILWTDILRLLENYANDTPPSPALEGMLWYDTLTKELKLNVGKYLNEPQWVIIYGKNIPNASNLLDGVLTKDCIVKQSDFDDCVVSKSYVDEVNVIKFDYDNNTYQYNHMAHNGFLLLNGVIKKGNINTSYVIDIPFIMRDINYSVTLSTSSVGEYLPSNDTLAEGHHYYIMDKTRSSFKVMVDINLPINGEINFCLVGYTV